MCARWHKKFSLHERVVFLGCKRARERERDSCREIGRKVIESSESSFEKDESQEGIKKKKRKYFFVDDDIIMQSWTNCQMLPFTYIPVVYKLRFFFLDSTFLYIEAKDGKIKKTEKKKARLSVNYNIRLFNIRFWRRPLRTRKKKNKNKKKTGD